LSLSTGIDVVSIERIRGVRHMRRFLARVFTGDELVYAFSMRDPMKHLAGRFAAKEACIKALSGKGSRVPAMKEIEVVVDENKRPRVVIHAPGAGARGCVKASRKQAASSAGPDVHVSIAYSAEKAMAFVVAEGGA